MGFFSNIWNCLKKDAVAVSDATTNDALAKGLYDAMDKTNNFDDKEREF